jgi:hypothetical protein
VTVLVLGDARRRKYVQKAAILFALLMWSYAGLFPGLLASAFSREKMLVRVFTRGLGLFDLAGITFLRDFYDWSGAYTWGIIEEEATYSGVEKVLRSPFAAVAVVAAVLVLVWYWRAISRMRRAGNPTWPIYPITAGVCVLTQFGVPYYGAPAFQCIFGFAMFPIFQALWPFHSSVHRAVDGPHAVHAPA